MIRRSQILTTAALLAVCAVPPVAGAKVLEEHSSAAPPVEQYQDLRSPDARDAAVQAAETPEVAQDLRSPDARDAGRPEVPAPDTVVAIREVPSGGFDWGDAGIGAAGILALLSIAGGLTLLITGRRRRAGSEMPAH